MLSYTIIHNWNPLDPLTSDTITARNADEAVMKGRAFMQELYRADPKPVVAALAILGEPIAYYDCNQLGELTEKNAGKTSVIHLLL